MMDSLINAFGSDTKTIMEYIKHGTNYKTYAPNMSQLSYKFGTGDPCLLMARLMGYNDSVLSLKDTLLHPVVIKGLNQAKEPYDCILNKQTKTKFILTQTKEWTFNNTLYITCKGLVITGDKISIITSPYFKVDDADTYLPSLKEFNLWINILKLLGEDVVRLSIAVKVSDAVLKGVFKTRGNDDINALLSLQTSTLKGEPHLITIYKHFLTMVKDKDNASV